MSGTWMLDELVHAGAEHLDEEFIAGYDRKQGYPDPAADIAALTAHGLDETSVVVDFGTGTGQFAIAAARRFGKVIAADVSAPMLAAVQAKAGAGAGAEGAAGACAGAKTKAGARAGALPTDDDTRPPRLEFVHGGFLSYTPAEPVDGVYTRHALHQLPDFWKVVALRRIADMLRPGGVLRLRDLIYDFAPGEASAVFDAWFVGAAQDPAAGYTAADYAEHIRTEHSTFRWLFEPMLAATGFTIADVVWEGKLYGTYTCVKTAD